MTAEPGEKPLEILLVEDNPGDARLTQEVLKDSQFASNLAVAEDGEVAMARLRNEGEHGSAPRPDLVLLDLKLPKMDGWEVLAQMNKDDDLRGIPVLILTATEAERSLLQTYNIPPSRYFKKPITLDRFENAVNQRESFSKDPIVGAITSQQDDTEESGDQQKKRWWWPF